MSTIAFSLKNAAHAWSQTSIWQFLGPFHYMDDRGGGPVLEPFQCAWKFRQVRKILDENCFTDNKITDCRTSPKAGTTGTFHESASEWASGADFWCTRS